MAADYTNLLSLDKASLVGRERQNSLGTQELVLDYHLQTGTAKEGAIDWLEANRLTLTNPSFSHRTYTGTYKCVSVAYNDKSNVIRQRFKIDSSLEDDVAQRSAAGDTLKHYYWRIVNPSAYNIPDLKTTSSASSPNLADVYWYDSGDVEGGESVYYDANETYAIWYTGSVWKISLVSDVGGTPANAFVSSGSEVLGVYTATGTNTGSVTVNSLPMVGEAWTKTANDNGDGTYDVVITQYKTTEYTGTSYTENASYTETTVVTLNASAVAQPAYEVGKIVTVTNVPLENGLFRTTVTTREAKPPLHFYATYPSDWDVSGLCDITLFYNYTPDAVVSLFSSMGIAYVNSPSVSRNEFGLYDGVIYRR